MRGWTVSCLCVLLWACIGCDSQSPRNDVQGDTANAPDVRVSDATGVIDLDATYPGTDIEDGSLLDAALMMDRVPMDAAGMATPDMDVPSPRARRLRAHCFEGEPVDTELEEPPHTCVDLYLERPELESGCYLLNDGSGGVEPSYCWHRRTLIFLANNEIETEPNENDTNGDGIIDEGPQRGKNFPPDPLGEDLDAVKTRLVREVREFFSELSYGAMYVEVIDVVTPRVEAGFPDRWFRLQQLRPGFAYEPFYREYCEQQGGMTPDDWVRIDYLVTIISDGTSTSGSQWRMETVPMGPNCEDQLPLQHNYMVVKRFQNWNRLGTLYHEIAHGFNRDPNPEPSLGHSESIQANTGDMSEYGDRSDVMGRSSSGHFSLAQKMFMRLLPTELVHTVDVDTALHSTVIYPIERSDRELKGLQIPVDNGRTYYVEARADLGGDREIPDILKSGALVKRASTVNRANKSWIIDCTPETPTQNSGDSTLLPHRTYADRENELFISVWNERPDGVHVVVRRGAPSIAPPTVDDIMIQQRGNQLTLVALTTPGDERIPNEDLLFFWKLGARTAITTPDNFATGRRVQIPTPEDGVPIWLLVSDQRGGETWTQVWPESP